MRMRESACVTACVSIASGAGGMDERGTCAHDQYRPGILIRQAATPESEHTRPPAFIVGTPSFFPVARVPGSHCTRFRPRMRCRAPFFPGKNPRPGGIHIPLPQGICIPPEREHRPSVRSDGRRAQCQGMHVAVSWNGREERAEWRAAGVERGRPWLSRYRLAWSEA